VEQKFNQWGNRTGFCKKKTSWFRSAERTLWK